MKTSLIRRRFTYKFYRASLYLIIINALVFLLTSLFPNLKVYLGLCPSLFLQYKMLWQPFTYMFVHSGSMHLISNMLGLFFFGLSLEKAIGSREFLLLYFTGGLLSGLLSLLLYILTGTYSAFLIGASGALFTILFSFAVVFPKANIYIWGLLPIPSPILILVYAAVELFSQFFGFRSNVAHFTHLFGFLVSYLYFIIRIGVNPFKVWKDAYSKPKDE